MSIQLYARIEKRPLHKSRVHKFPKSFVPNFTIHIPYIQDDMSLEYHWEGDKVWWIWAYLQKRKRLLNRRPHSKWNGEIFVSEYFISSEIYMQCHSGRSWDKLGMRGECYFVTVLEQYQKMIFDMIYQSEFFISCVPPFCKFYG